MVNRSIIPLRLLIIPMILLYDDYPILQQSCQLNLPKSNPINSTIRLFHSRYVPTNPHFTRGSAISQVSKTGRTPCSLYFKPFTALFLLSIQPSPRAWCGGKCYISTSNQIVISMSSRWFDRTVLMS